MTLRTRFVHLSRNSLHLVIWKGPQGWAPGQAYAIDLRVQAPSVLAEW